MNSIGWHKPYSEALVDIKGKFLYLGYLRVQKFRTFLIGSIVHLLNGDTERKLSLFSH